MKKTYVYGFLVLLGIIASYVIILFLLDPTKAKSLTTEDGITENLSVLCYFLSGGLFFYLFFKSKSTTGKYIFGTRRNYFFLILGVFCFLILGEEINWGQRIFEVDAPEWIAEKESGEMNLHNLDTLFTIFGIRINAARIYFPIVILYFMLIPILNKFSSKAEGFFKKMSLPIVPLTLAILYLFNFIIFRIFVGFDLPQGFNDISYPQTTMEVYEIDFAILLLWNSIAFYLTNKRETIVTQ